MRRRRRWWCVPHDLPAGPATAGSRRRRQQAAQGCAFLALCASAHRTGPTTCGSGSPGTGGLTGPPGEHQILDRHSSPGSLISWWDNPDRATSDRMWQAAQRTRRLGAAGCAWDLGQGVGDALGWRVLQNFLDLAGRANGSRLIATTIFCPHRDVADLRARIGWPSWPVLDRSVSGCPAGVGRVRHRC